MLRLGLGEHRYRDIGFAKERCDGRRGGTGQGSIVRETGILELHQHMPAGKIVAQFSPEYQLCPSNRQAVLASAFRNDCVYMPIQKLQGVQADIDLVPQDWKHFGLTLPVL